MGAHRSIKHLLAALVAATAASAAPPAGAADKHHRVRYLGVQVRVRPNPAGTRSTINVSFRARQPFSYTASIYRRGSSEAINCESEPASQTIYVRPGRIARFSWPADPVLPWCAGRWSVLVRHIDYGPDPCAGYGDSICRDSPEEYPHPVGGAHFTIRRYAKHHRRHR